MLFTKEDAARLAEGKDDGQLDELGRRHGFLQLACDFEGIDVSRGLKTTDFARTNPYVHRAHRHGAIEAVRASELPTKPGDATVDPSSGNFLPQTRVVFKGEE